MTTPDLQASAPDKSEAWVRQVFSGAIPDPELELDAVAAVVSYADNQGVASLLHHLLPSATANPGAASIRSALREHSIMSAARELAWRNELLAVFNTLCGHDIPFFIFKGTALAYSLYPQAYQRERCDTDIVFRSKGDASAAWELLQSRGYTRGNAITGDTITTQFACTRHLTGGVSLTLDIHWRINNHLDLANAFTFHELFEASESVTELLPSIRAPRSEYALALACLHRAAHRAQGLHNRLIWLYDIRLLLEQLNSQQETALIDLARKKSIAAVVLDGINAAEAAVGADASQDLKAGLSQVKTDKDLSLDSYSSHWKSALSQFRALESRASRFQYLMDNLFPPPGYILLKYGKKRRAWLPLLYMRRIIEGLAKRAR